MKCGLIDLPYFFHSPLSVFLICFISCKAPHLHNTGEVTHLNELSCLELDTNAGIGIYTYKHLVFQHDSYDFLGVAGWQKDELDIFVTLGLSGIVLSHGNVWQEFKLKVQVI